jgi:hypothetical protein
MPGCSGRLSGRDLLSWRVVGGAHPTKICDPILPVALGDEVHGGRLSPIEPVDVSELVAPKIVFASAGTFFA